MFVMDFEMWWKTDIWHISSIEHGGGTHEEQEIKSLTSTLIRITYPNHPQGYEFLSFKDLF